MVFVTAQKISGINLSITFISLQEIQVYFCKVYRAESRQETWTQISPRTENFKERR